MEQNLTIVIELSPEVTPTDNLPVQFFHGLQPSARVLEAHCGCSKERLSLWMAVKLDAVHSGYLVTDLLEESALHALVQTNHKDIPLRGFPLPELVVLDRDFQNRKSKCTL